MSNEIIDQPENKLPELTPGTKVMRVDRKTAGMNIPAVIGHLAQYANLASIINGIKRGAQYVVQVPTHLQPSLDTGEYTMLHGEKSGQTWATIVEKLPNGKNDFIANCPIKEEAFFHGNPLHDISNSLVSFQLQQQIAALAQLVGETYDAILRVEGGQKADRIGQLTAGRNGIVHALKMKDEESRRLAIVVARGSLQEAQGKIGAVLRQKVSEFKVVPKFAAVRFFKECAQTGYLDKRDDKFEEIHEYYDLYMQATRLIAESFIICAEQESASSVFEACRQFIGSLDFSRVGTILYMHPKMPNTELFYHQAEVVISEEKASCLDAGKPYDAIEIILDGWELMEVLKDGWQEET